MAKKGISRTKTDKWTLPLNQHSWSSLDTKFHLERQFWFFGPNLPKKSIFSPKNKNWTNMEIEYHYWIKHIRITLNASLNDTHRVKCVLLNSVQEFIEAEACLVLTFFLCLHNQLISTQSIVTHMQMFEKCDSSNRQK